MSIYDIDYKEVGRQLLPPDKRGPNMKAWVNTLLKPLQYLRDLWLGDYRTGSIGLPWIALTPYVLGDRVTFKGSAYESIVFPNTGNLPTDQNFWKVVQQNFIGVMERVLYTGNALIFIYAINKYFGTVFRQPNNVSDIYVTVYPKPASVFVVGSIEQFSSKIFTTTSSEFVIDAYSFSAYFNMTIFVPLAVFNALDIFAPNREKIIRNFADRYLIAGIKYNVSTY